MFLQSKDSFISYGRRESLGFVGRLHQQLKLAGYDSWFDKVNIPDGEDYAQRINHGIESAHNFVYVMAPRCLTSPYCLIELEYARLLGKRIIPINQIVIFDTPEKNLSEGDKQILVGFYKFHNLPDQKIHTTQDVLNRSHALVGRTDWLDAKEKVSDSDCQRLVEWAQPYENNWAKHDNLDYLKSFEFPIFGESIDALGGVVERIVAVLERKKSYVHRHTEILSNALHWEKNQKATQHLLVGKERTAAEDWLLTEFLPPKQPPCQPSTLICEFICEARKNAENMMTDIFISYDTQDKAIRNSVIQSLSRHAKTTWIHDRDIQKGTDYGRAINIGIENADNFFYFISPHSIISEYCQLELEYALKYNKRIVPLLIAPTPESEIPEAVRGLQFVDFTDNICQADYDSDIDDILNILRLDQAYYEQHKLFLARALKWQRENRKPSFLLRGHNLENAKTWLRLNEGREEHPPLPLHHELITISEAAKGQLGTEVFISYSRKDSDFARHLNTTLQEAGKTTWFDQESISTGVNFEKEIFKGIDNADTFLFVLSPDAVESEYCEREVGYATEQGKRFITVLHRDTEPATMPKALRTINWIDFKDSPFEKSFPELVQAIELDREHAHQHTILQQRGNDWEENRRSGNFLLNITACSHAESWLKTAANKQPAPTTLQQDFIRQSRAAIEAAERVVQRRRNITLASVSAGMVLAIFLSVFAFAQMVAANVQKEEANHQKDIALAEKDKAEIAKQEALKAKKAAEIAKQEAERERDKATKALKEAERQKQLALKAKADADTQRHLAVKAKQDAEKALKQATQAKAKAEHQKQVAKRAKSFAEERSAYAEYQTEVAKIQKTVAEEQRLEANQQKQQAISSQQQAQQAQQQSQQAQGESERQRQQAEEQKLIAEEQTLIAEEQKQSAQIAQKEAETERDNATKAKAEAEEQKHLAQIEKARAETERDNATKAEAKAEKQAQIALSRQLSAQAIIAAKLPSLGNGSVDLALLLAAQLFKFDKIAGQETLLRVIQNSQLKTYLYGHTHAVVSVAISPNGQLLASASYDHTMRLWDIKTQAPLGEPLLGHTDKVRNVAFSPDGKFLASASYDHTVRLWDVETQAPLGEPLLGHTDRINNIAFSPDGKQLASGSNDKTVILWDIETQASLGEPLQGHTDLIWSVTFSPDGKQLASGSSDNTVILWDVETQAPLGKPLQKHTDKVRSVAFSPDGKKLASGSDDQTVRLWDVEAQEAIGEPLLGHTDRLRGVTFSPDGEYLASASDDQTVRLWNVDSLTPFGEPLLGHIDDVKDVAFSPDGEYLISASDNSAIILWNVDRKTSIGESLLGHTSLVTSVAFSPDGKQLASASDDSTVILWDVEAQASLGEPLLGHTSLVTSVAFSPDGKQLASASDDSTVILWDVEAQVPLGEPLLGHTSDVNSVAFSPDGKQLASGSDDNTVILWDIEAQASLGEPLLGHTSDVNSVVFSHDGKLLASASTDNTVILWDVNMQVPLGEPLRGHTYYINSVAFSPDGKQLASGSSDNTVILWDIDPQSWVNRACRIANRNLSLEEWSKYFGETPHQKTCPELPKDTLGALKRIREAENETVALVREGGFDAVVDKFEEARELDARLVTFDIEERATELFAPALVQLGRNLAEEGEIEPAIAKYKEALQMDSGLEISAHSWNTLCWYGSLYGYVEQVMAACETAVDLAPEFRNYRKSRGLARALTGDTQGAIEDFQFYVDEDENEQVQDWIDALEAGENPFTEVVLEELR